MYAKQQVVCKQWGAGAVYLQASHDADGKSRASLGGWGPRTRLPVAFRWQAPDNRKTCPGWAARWRRRSAFFAVNRNGSEYPTVCLACVSGYDVFTANF
jgi:hypothetical protein